MQQKQFFALKLIPSRPDFAQTMTEQEREIMGAHIAYWQPYMEQGIMLVMGPVMEPAGMYGLGIVEVDSEEQLKEIIKDDPAGAINTFEYYPMMAMKGSR